MMIEQARAPRNDQTRIGPGAMNLDKGLKNAGRVLARLDAAHTEEHTARSETQTMPKLRIGLFYLGAISACVHAIAADFSFAPEALDYVFSPQRAYDHPGVRCEDRSRLPPDETRVGEIVVEPALRETADMVEQRIDDYLRWFRRLENRRFDLYHAHDGIGANALATLKEEGLIPAFIRTVHHIGVTVMAPVRRSSALYDRMGRRRRGDFRRQLSDQPAERRSSATR
jgi:hypothetical protein